MKNDEQEIIDSTNDTDEVIVEDVEDIEDLDEEETDVETLKKQNKTLLAQKNHWRDKATKKTDEAPQVTKKETSNNKDAGLSQTDLYALVKANVAEEDISEVAEYANFKGITVAEALKSPVVKNILSEKEEFRNSAAAANTGGAKRGPSKISDETLIRNASKGIMPDSDEDLERLVRLRKGIK